MEIILSHIRADFDALASMVAAGKLYPQARLVLPGSPEPAVREFLALHKGYFPVEPATALRGQPLERIVLVDTRIPSRLGPFRTVVSDPAVHLHIFDHHPATPEAVRGDLEVIEPVGAAVTLVLRQVRQRGLPVSPVEATLFLLGIYEETGLLTFPSTTPEDLRTAAWLLEQGASLELVPRFIHIALTPAQRLLLNELVAGCQVRPLGGMEVALAAAERDEYVDDLSALTGRLLDLEDCAAALVAVRMRTSVYVVGRSRERCLDVGRLLRPLGGGGHATAASARTTGRSPWEVLEDLWRRLKESLPRPATAADLMSAPVECLDLDDNPDLSVAEAGAALRRLGHSAACLRLQGRVVGMISRSDVDRALAHGLDHAPARAYMTTPVVSVQPSTPVEEIRRLLVERDIGRVPVMEGERLVGIVSRSDILRHLHQTQAPPPEPEEGLPELLRLPPGLLALLRQCGETGDRLGHEVYLVGGFVRDLLLGLPNQDVDLVVEGRALEFARELARAHPGSRLHTHEKFGTAVVIFPDGFRLDVASARTEIYTRPAALPVVSGSTLKQDLVRRDFSINAMAVRLTGGRFGQLIDYFGARRDLESGLIRVLHNHSFIDDPTRMLRAVRLEQRLRFRLDPATEHLLRAALAQGVLEMVSPDRLRDEFIEILREPDPLPALQRLDRLGILRRLHPRLALDSRTMRVLERVEPVCARYADVARVERWRVYLLALVSRLGRQDLEELRQRLRLHLLPGLEQELDVGLVRRLAGAEVRDSQLHRWLKHLPLEALLYLEALPSSSRVGERIERYLRVVRRVEPLVRGDHLMAWGYPPGPAYRRMLSELFEAQLDGQISSVEEGRRWLEELFGPPPGPGQAGG
jgi:tRNA nucleotidyltransferase (CCA-adding enzyme)